MRNTPLSSTADLKASKNAQVRQNRISFAIIECRNGASPVDVIYKYQSEHYRLSPDMIARALRREGISVPKNC